MERMQLEVSWASLWRVVVVVMVAAILYVVRDVLVSIFLAVVISAGLAPFVDWMEGKGIPRLLGVLLIYLSIFMVVGLAFYAVLPVAAVEFRSLFSNLIDLSGDLFSSVSAENFFETINENIELLSGGLLSGGSSFLAAASSVLGGLVLVVSVAVISFYLALSRDGVEWFLRALLPERHEERFLKIFRRSKRRIGLWLQTQILLSLVVGVMSFVGLAILGVRNAFVLGLIAAIFEIVPFVGPVFAGSLAVLVALSDSFTLGVYVVILFVLVQQVESNFIIPSVFQRSIGLHPVMVLAAFMVGYTLAGLAGVILAVPMAVILQEMLDDWVSIKDHRRAMREGVTN